MPSKDESAASIPSFVRFKQGLRVQSAQYHAGETILETARRAGVTINTNCVQGYCGTCWVSLLKGKVHMRKNKALTQRDLEDGSILACQSVPEAADCLIEIDQ